MSAASSNGISTTPKSKMVIAAEAVAEAREALRQLRLLVNPSTAGPRADDQVADALLISEKRGSL